MDNNDQHLSQDEESHGFNLETGKTWIYPTNYPIRDYQYNIVSQALFTNTMVCLPTGLGKTFIAAVVMYNYFRWYPNGKIIFMAPTKPLVKQQVEACYNIMAIPKDATAELTGTTAQTSRDDIWEEKRVFFITPQVLQNDLERIARLGRRIKCLVFDEAHKARGNFAYCEVIKKIHPITRHFRVLALTATPGSSVSDVVKVCGDLLISHMEIRTEDNPDVAKYVFKRNVETIVVPFDAKLKQVIDDYNLVLDRFVRVLVNNRVIHGNCSALTKGRMFYIKKEYMEKNVYTRGAQHNEIMKNLNICCLLYHAHEVLTKHGLRGFLTYFKENEDKPLFRNIDDVRRIVDDISEHLGEIPDVDMLPDGTVPRVPESTKFGHPKFYKLAEVLTRHFSKLDEGQSDRVIVFCEYVESVMEAYTILLMHRPLIKPRIFLGQATITQKQQINVLQSFRRGDCNTLVSTSIGEEGLDIGDVNLVVCFDISNKSSIRMIQRMGRTGRKREGNVVMLVTEGREHQTLRDCLAHKDYMINAMKTSKELHKSLYKDSPAMIPAGIKPVCNKMFITVDKEKNNGSLPGLFNKMREGNQGFDYSDVAVVDFVDRIPKPCCLFIKTAKEAFATANEHNYNIEANRVLQSSYGEIASSEDSKAMVSLLEYSNSLRFDISCTQSNVVNKVTLRSDKYKQSDIRSMFQKQTLSQIDFQKTLNTVAAVEQSADHKELQSELNNYLSNINFDCKICSNLFACDTYKQDTVLEPWIVPENNVLNSLTKESLRIFTEGLKADKMVIDDDIMKEFEDVDFEESFMNAMSPQKDCSFENAKKDSIQAQLCANNFNDDLNNGDCNEFSTVKEQNCENDEKLQSELNNIFQDDRADNEVKPCLDDTKQKRSSFMPIPELLQAVEKRDNKQQDPLEFFKMSNLNELFQPENSTSITPNRFVKKVNRFEKKNDPIKSELPENAIAPSNDKIDFQSISGPSNAQTPSQKSSQRKIVYSPDIFSEDSNQSEPQNNGTQDGTLADIKTEEDIETRSNFSKIQQFQDQFHKNIEDRCETKKTFNKSVCFNSKTKDTHFNSKTKDTHGEQLNGTITINDICGDDLLDIFDLKPPENKQHSTSELLRENITKPVETNLKESTSNNCDANVGETVANLNGNSFDMFDDDDDDIFMNVQTANENQALTDLELNDNNNEQVKLSLKRKLTYEDTSNSKASLEDAESSSAVNFEDFFGDDFSDLNANSNTENPAKRAKLSSANDERETVAFSFKPPAEKKAKEVNHLRNIEAESVNDYNDDVFDMATQKSTTSERTVSADEDDVFGLSTQRSPENNERLKTHKFSKPLFTKKVNDIDIGTKKSTKSERHADEDDVFGLSTQRSTETNERLNTYKFCKPVFTKKVNDIDTATKKFTSSERTVLADEDDVFGLSTQRSPENNERLKTHKFSKPLFTKKVNDIDKATKKSTTSERIVSVDEDDVFGVSTQRSTENNERLKTHKFCKPVFTKKVNDVRQKGAEVSCNRDDVFGDDFFGLSTQQSNITDMQIKKPSVSTVKKFVKSSGSTKAQSIEKKCAEISHNRDDFFSEDFFGLSTQKLVEVKKPAENITKNSEQNASVEMTPENCDDDDIFELNTQKSDCLNGETSRADLNEFNADDDIFDLYTQKPVEEEKPENDAFISDDDIFYDGDFNVVKDEKAGGSKLPDNVAMKSGEEFVKKEELLTPTRNNEEDFDSDDTVVLTPGTVSEFVDLLPQETSILISDDDSNDSEIFGSFTSKSKKSNQNIKSCEQNGGGNAKTAEQNNGRIVNTRTKNAEKNCGSITKTTEQIGTKTTAEKPKQRVFERTGSEEDFATPASIKKENAMWKKKPVFGGNKPRLERLKINHDSEIDDLMKKYSNKTPEKSKTQPSIRCVPLSVLRQEVSPILNQSQAEFSPVFNKSQARTAQISPVLNKSQRKPTYLSPIVNKTQSPSQWKKRSAFRSPGSPLFKENRLKRAKVDFGSNSNIHVSSDDDFETSPFKRKSPAKTSVVKKQKKGTSEFFENEAVLSSGEDVSEDERSGSSLDCMEESFLDDETDLANKTTMHAHYLQTIRSPVKGRYKIPQLPRTINQSIFSQAVDNEDNTYHEDSFCVKSDEDEGTSELSELEIAERILKERRKAKNKPVVKKRRRRILIDSSDTD